MNGQPAKNVKSRKLLLSFWDYCVMHPEERFWQALRNWCGRAFVLVSDVPIPRYQVGGDILDTFYWEGKND